MAAPASALSLHTQLLRCLLWEILFSGGVLRLALDSGGGCSGKCVSLALDPGWWGVCGGECVSLSKSLAERERGVTA